MRFFIPHIQDAEQEQSFYDAIKQFLSQEIGADFSDRRVFSLRYHHEGKDYHAKVGEEHPLNSEVVMAILYDQRMPAYCICTPNRGVARGMPILVGKWQTKSVVDFD